jgi:hypothetical protein
MTAILQETGGKERTRPTLASLKKIVHAFIHREKLGTIELPSHNESPFAAAKIFAEPVDGLKKEFTGIFRDDPVHLAKTQTTIMVDQEFPQRSRDLNATLKELILPRYPEHGEDAVRMALDEMEKRPIDSVDEDMRILGGITEEKILKKTVQAVIELAKNTRSGRLIMERLHVDKIENINGSVIDGKLCNLHLIMQSVFSHVIQTVLDKRDENIIKNSKNVSLVEKTKVRSKIRKEESGSVTGILGRHLSFIDDLPNVGVVDFLNGIGENARELKNHKIHIQEHGKKSFADVDNEGDVVFRAITDSIWDGRFNLSAYPDGLMITQPIPNKNKPNDFGSRVFVILPFTDSTFVCYSYVPSKLSIGPGFREFYITDQKLSLLTSKAHIDEYLHGLVRNVVTK